MAMESPPTVGGRGAGRHRRRLAAVRSDVRPGRLEKRRNAAWQRRPPHGYLIFREKRRYTSCSMESRKLNLALSVYHRCRETLHSGDVAPACRSNRQIESQARLIEGMLETWLAIGIGKGTSIRGCPRRGVFILSGPARRSPSCRAGRNRTASSPELRQGSRRNLQLQRRPERMPRLRRQALPWRRSRG